MLTSNNGAEKPFFLGSKIDVCMRVYVCMYVCTAYVRMINKKKGPNSQRGSLGKQNINTKMVIW